MQQPDIEKFKSGLSGVYAFYGKELTEFHLNVWWEALKAYDLTAVTEAFNRHLVNPDSGQFLPKPADIVRMFGGRSQDSALNAWSKVDSAVRHVGPYRDVVFDDPLIHRVIHDMGGWTLISQKSSDEWPFVAKEFENRYRGYRMRSEVPDYPKILTGISNAYNGRKGLQEEPPMLIGEYGLCKLTMTKGTIRALTEYKQLAEHIEGAA